MFPVGSTFMLNLEEITICWRVCHAQDIPQVFSKTTSLLGLFCRLGAK
jgi:hypothetical protein